MSTNWLSGRGWSSAQATRLLRSPRCPLSSPLSVGSSSASVAAFARISSASVSLLKLATTIRLVASGSLRRFRRVLPPVLGLLGLAVDPDTWLEEVAFVGGSNMGDIFGSKRDRLSDHPGACPGAAMDPEPEPPTREPLPLPAAPAPDPGGPAPTPGPICPWAPCAPCVPPAPACVPPKPGLTPILLAPPLPVRAACVNPRPSLTSTDGMGTCPGICGRVCGCPGICPPSWPGIWLAPALSPAAENPASVPL